MRTVVHILLSLICLLPLTARAQVENFGDYTVYYSVVNSTFVTPEIAQQYGITRGQRNAFLNISVQKKTATGSTVPVNALVTGQKRNLLQQSSAIVFSEVTEGTAIKFSQLRLLVLKYSTL